MPNFTGSTNDGMVRGQNAVYATARSTATVQYATLEYMIVGQDATYKVDRAYLKFDTSGIPDDATINQVNLTLVATNDYSGVDFDVNIIKQDWSAQDPLSSGNMDTAFDNCLTSPEDDAIWRNTSGLVVNTAYVSGNLNAAWINKAGATYYSLASNRDYDGSGTAPTGTETVWIASANNSTAEYRPVLNILYTVPQSLAGTITPAGAVVKRGGKPLAGAVTPAGAVVKLTIPAAKTGTITPAGAVTKQTGKPLSGAVTPAGAVVKQANKVLAGVVTPAGAIVRAIGKVLAGAVTPTGAVTKQTTPLLFTGAITPTGAVVKQTNKPFAGVLTPVGDLVRRAGKVLAGAITPAGAVVKQTNTSAGGIVTPAGAVIKQTNKILAGALTPVGAIARRVNKILAGILSFIGAAIPEHLRRGTVAISDAATSRVAISDAGAYLLTLSDAAASRVAISDAAGE